MNFLCNTTELNRHVNAGRELHVKQSCARGRIQIHSMALTSYAMRGIEQHEVEESWKTERMLP